MTTVSVRYIVTDVGEAIDFYCRHLGFHEDMHPAPSLRHAVARRSAGDAQRTWRRPRRRPGDTRTAHYPRREAGTGSASRSPT